MPTLLDEALEVLRDLPENVQRNVAGAILEYAATCEEEHLHA